ncbi:hypothetical protein [Bradyrhizobium prioriisuperbiae]|uniref:hypothetical protein n=1 Tax=Bradyrhizobium prioriisuperbiae TaxID=2854389 RepID=UPI0028EC9C2C|nr:hypothetical protein [Bradyrhizobium prioritasuperba]
MTTIADFHAALAAAGISSQQPRIETDGDYKYECFDDAEGAEIAFISWHAGEPTYVVRDRAPQAITARDVREHYTAQGYEVRIGDDGHIEFRLDGGEWREGRYLSEYRMVDGQVVLV